MHRTGSLFFPDPWWKKEVDAITDDLDTAIEFVRSECIDEELYWLAEVFDEIMKRIPSKAFDSLSQRTRSIEKTNGSKMFSKRFARCQEMPITKTWKKQENVYSRFRMLLNEDAIYYTSV